MRFKAYRQVSCGCCTGEFLEDHDRCVCRNHMDVPRGIPVHVCKYHKDPKHPHTRQTEVVPEAEFVAERVWRQYVSTNELPPGIPPNPDEVYATQGWRGWCDFLGLDPNEIDVEKVRNKFGGKARAH